MEKQKKVIDASVAVKWFLDEAESEKARVLREDHIHEKILLIVPEIIFLEVINALRWKGATSQELTEANGILWDLQLKREKLTTEIMKTAIGISLKHQITLYDAVYLALGQMHGCFVTTADEKLMSLPQVVRI